MSDCREYHSRRMVAVNDAESVIREILNDIPRAWKHLEGSKSLGAREEISKRFGILLLVPSAWNSSGHSELLGSASSWIGAVSTIFFFTGRFRYEDHTRVYVRQEAARDDSEVQAVSCTYSSTTHPQ